MLTNLLQRSIGTVERRLVLLAPPDRTLPEAFENVDHSPSQHARLLADLQRLRGSIYLRDGAVEAHQLSSEGRHQTSEDERSWHLLMVDERGRVDACVWYMGHQPSIPVDRLRVRNCPLLEQPAWRNALVRAVESELAHAKQHGMSYAEVGGWAVAEKSRCTSEGLVLALAGYSLGRVLGGALGLTTATVRHCSSTILRRLGGTDLRVADRTIPSYYDTRYKCQMELLRFDSRQPSAKYSQLVELLKEKLTQVLVVSPLERPASQTEFDDFSSDLGFQPSLAVAG